MSYEDLFAVNAGEKFERDEKALAVRLEKEYEANKIATKVNLAKENKIEEQKSDENSEPIEENREGNNNDRKKQAGDELTEEVGTSGDNLGGQTGASTIEEQKSEMIISGTAKFGESLSGRLEYEESWEEYINGE